SQYTRGKKSCTNLGRFNIQRALELSSNLFIFKTAIALGKGENKPHQALPIDTTALDTFRNNISQFGLGDKTGNEHPKEIT
ncbi:penicillin-binding transpeptidase domain-containing protein, partial [Bacillus subtilis]|uniref:penicillin-binding transpeptidase domain-containing protein n=1 Tax=Bacillus subtilis TaxID=1423 RepID=UPI0024AD7EE6